MSAQSSHEIDALVVGAGPVGLTLAAELTRHGMTCRIIDKSPTPTDKSKALVLWSRSLEMLQDMGTVETFVAAGQAAHGASIYSGARRLVHIQFDLDSPYDYGLMIPQSETERLLAEHLQRLGVGVERRLELESFTTDTGGVTSTIRAADGTSQVLRSRWLMGCDGAHSTVRHGLGIDFSGAAEPNDWVLADIHVSGPLANDEITIFFHTEGLLAFFPIAPERYRVIADLGLASTADHPADPTLEEVQHLVERRGPGGLVLSAPIWLAGFRINERKVDAYRHGRVFLVGDAAHIHSPAGGQGMNTGMQDAYNLAWKLALVQHGRGRDALLDSYSSERGAVGDEVLRNAGILTRAATLRNPMAQQVRNHLYGFLGALEVVQRRMGDTLSELAINYRRSPIVGEHRSRAAHAWLLGGGVVPGDRAPDAALIDASSGAATTLFDVLRGTQHTLLLFIGASGDGDTTLAEIGTAVQSRYPDLAATHLVVSGRTLPPNLSWKGSLLLDPEGVLHSRYGAGAATAYLIRPDGYVGYRTQPAEVSGLLEHMGKYLT